MSPSDSQTPPVEKKTLKDWLLAGLIGALAGAVAGFAAHQGKAMGFVAFVALAIVILVVRGAWTRLFALGSFGAAAAVVAALLER